MQPRTPAFDATVLYPHTAAAAVNVIQDGKVTMQPAAHSGHVTADRMSDQMRQMEVELADPLGTLTPVDMNSPLAPYGGRIQLMRGVRISTVDRRVRTYGVRQSWLPTGGSTGVMNGVKIDSSNALTLGP